MKQCILVNHHLADALLEIGCGDNRQIGTEGQARFPTGSHFKSCATTENRLNPLPSNAPWMVISSISSHAPYSGITSRTDIVVASVKPHGIENARNIFMLVGNTAAFGHVTAQVQGVRR